MKVLFIGGTGNISLACTKLAIEQGVDIWLLNRTGSHPECHKANYIQCDISSSSELQQAIDGHYWDVIVNFIAFTKDDVQRDIELFQGITDHYVFISSASCYQNPGPTPYITEQTPLNNPYWEYSQNKIAAELLLENAYQSQQFPVTIVRPSHTYDRIIPLTLGGGSQYTAVNRIKYNQPIVIHGDGTSLWTLTHSDDFAIGLCGLLGQQDAIGEAFHITSDEFLSWNEIALEIGNYFNVKPSIVHVSSDKICKLQPRYTGTLLGDKACSALFDNSKIKRYVPTFKQSVPFKKGIVRTLEWYEQNPEMQRVDEEANQFIQQLIDSELSCVT